MLHNRRTRRTGVRVILHSGKFLRRSPTRACRVPRSAVFKAPLLETHGYEEGRSDGIHGVLRESETAVQARS